MPDQQAKAYHVPYQRNPYFTGRGELLEKLRGWFTAERPGARRHALVGMGGVGKSQVALEYAYRHRDDHRIVWWLSAEDPTALGVGYAKLAAAIGVNVSPESSLDEVRHRLRRALDESNDWLLIFDNVARVEDVKSFLPLRGAGHVLITSQLAEWGDLAQTTRVRELSREESIEFLAKRTHRGDAAGLASKLAQTVGDLPLALEQAAAVIEQTGSSYEDYLRRFETHWGELLQRGHLSPDHPDSLAMTLELTFRQIADESAAAVGVLHFCAFLAPEQIGKELLIDAANLLSPDIAGSVAYQLEETLGPLERYSLIENTPQSISMHRLVSALARQRLSHEEKVSWSTVAAQMLASSMQFDGMNPSTWTRCGELLPHALAAAAHAEKLGVSPQSVEAIFSNAGRYLLKQARLREAQALLERAVLLAPQLYGSRHPRVSDAANNLARALQKLGDLPAAAAHYELALSIDRDSYGEADPRVAAVSNNYGMCLLATGHVDEAKYHFEWALSTYQQHYGEEHPKVASVMNNLGCALRDGMELDAARERFDEALRVAEVACGTDHPTVASILYNTAVLLRNSGELERAEQAVRRALLIDETSFGSSHPDVARDLHELSRILQQSGNQSHAKEYADRASAVISDFSASASHRAAALEDAFRSAG